MTGETGTDVDAERVRELADRLGIATTADERSDLAAVVRDAVGTVERYDPPAFRPPTADVDRPDGEVRDPGDGGDPAWITRCSVGGDRDGRLAGLDVGVKDNLALAGYPMTCGSRLLSDFEPSVDATVCRRLLAAGARIVGKCNLESFAWSGSSDCSDYGTVPNPHDADRLAGGSSSGSAVAVARGDCDAAIGTDQGGSIRIPAAWCGVVGLKPTHGLVPYTGGVPLDPTIDHAGPLAADVATAARVLDAVAGEDRHDGVRLDARQPPGVGDEVGTYAGGLDGPGPDPGEFRVAVLEEGFGWDASDPAVDRTVRAAVDRLADAGATVESVSVPRHRDSLSLIAALEAQGGGRTVAEHGEPTHRDGWYWPGLARALRERVGDPDRGAALPATMKAALLTGRHLADRAGVEPYARGKNAVLRLRRAYDRALSGYDALAVPTVPMPPYDRDPDLPRRERLGRIVANHRNTATFDHTHHPALSVPCGAAGGLPVGLQLVGERFDDRTLLRLGRCVERTSGRLAAS